MLSQGDPEKYLFLIKNSEVVNKNFTALRLILHYTSLRTSPHFTTHFTNFTFKFQGVTMGVTWKGERGQPPYFTGFREFQPTSIPITSHASASFRRKGVSARCFLCLKMGILDGTVVVHTIDNRALHEYCLFRFFNFSPPLTIQLSLSQTSYSIHRVQCICQVFQVACNDLLLQDPRDRQCTE